MRKNKPNKVTRTNETLGKYNKHGYHVRKSHDASQGIYGVEQIGK